MNFYGNPEQKPGGQLSPSDRYDEEDDEDGSHATAIRQMARHEYQGYDNQDDDDDDQPILPMGYENQDGEEAINMEDMDEEILGVENGLVMDAIHD